MKDWLEANPYGLKEEFEKYFKMLPIDIRKVSDYIDFACLLVLNLFCI